MWTRPPYKAFITDEEFDNRFQGNIMEAVYVGDWRRITLEEGKKILDDINHMIKQGEINGYKKL